MDNLADHLPLPVLNPPRTRGECASVPRPCPWARCRYHMVHMRLPRLRKADAEEVGEMVASMPPDGSCVLDVADRGAQTLDTVAQAIGVTRQRAQQLDARGLKQAQRAVRRLDLAEDLHDGIADLEPPPGNEWGR